MPKATAKPPDRIAQLEHDLQTLRTELDALHEWVASFAPAGFALDRDLALYEIAAMIAGECRREGKRVPAGIATYLAAPAGDEDEAEDEDEPECHLSLVRNTHDPDRAEDPLPDARPETEPMPERGTERLRLVR